MKPRAASSTSLRWPVKWAAAMRSTAPQGGGDRPDQGQCLELCAVRTGERGLPALIHETAIYGTIPEYRRAEYARQEVLKEPILPSGVAEVILLLVGDAMRHITGRVIPVDNGAYPR